MDTGNINQKFSGFSEHWQPKVIASLNGQEVKLFKACGVFPWHHHDDIDEMFLVWKGRLRVEFRDRFVDLGPGDFLVVPKGLEHRTAADDEAEVIVFEPTDVLNTGNIMSEIYTAPKGTKI